MNYIVNSCFEIEPQNTVDNGIRYLLGMEMQDCKVSWKSVWAFQPIELTVSSFSCITGLDMVPELLSNVLCSDFILLEFREHVYIFLALFCFREKYYTLSKCVNGRTDWIV